MKKTAIISIQLVFISITTFGQSNQYQNDIADAGIEQTSTITNFDTTKTKREVPWFVERFKISAGFYEAMNNTNIKVGTNSGSIGTTIDFENSLGFTKYSPSFFADIQWRSTSRSRFILSYYNLRRDAKYKLRESIDFGNNTYDINADVYAYFNTAIYRFSYGYAIFSKPKYELGLLIGTHIIGAKAGIGLDTNVASTEVSDNFGVTAPLPDFGIWGGYAFTNRLALNAEIDYLAVKINTINGKILAYNLSIIYKATRNLNFSTGFSGLNFKVDAYNDNLNGHLRWGNNGILFKATYTFGNKNWR
ncbi:MAG: hypothetical protein KAX93_01690 [Flavobacterium sp.]|nr:hypothetical protein [Flavobacterium sp.]